MTGTETRFRGKHVEREGDREAAYHQRSENAVSKVGKTLDRVLRGNADANIRFDDLRAVLSHLGFVERIRGDHHIFHRDGVSEILNLQPRGGKAKAYQVKQVRTMITSHGLAGRAEEEENDDG